MLSISFSSFCPLHSKCFCFCTCQSSCLLYFQLSLPKKDICKKYYGVLSFYVVVKHTFKAKVFKKRERRETRQSAKRLQKINKRFMLVFQLYHSRVGFPISDNPPGWKSSSRNISCSNCFLVGEF